MDEPHSATELIGSVVNERYRVLRVLGEGGMGKVYEAKHELLGRKVALKTLLPTLARDPDLAERFRREARAASTIGHEHIVDVNDMGTLPDGSPFLVMELLDGVELADLIDEVGPLAIGRAVSIVRKVCSALAAAHAAGIVHRDLKPANIFLVSRTDDVDFPKVLDFGISKLSGSDQGLTATGVAIGTPAYMSPEQAQGLRSVDGRTDIYAMGAILYESLTGRRPLEAPSHASLLLKILTQDPDPPSRVRPDLPPELDAIVLRALAKQPEDRFASMDDLALALEPFAELRGAAPRGAVTLGQRRGPVVHTSLLLTEDGSAPGSSAGDTASPRVDTPQAHAKTAPSVQTASALPKKPFPFAIAGAALAALVGAAALAIGLSGGDAPEADEASETEPAAEVTVAEPPTVPLAGSEVADSEVADRVAEPREVRVRVRVVPTDARLYVADVEFPNPMDAQQLRSTQPVALRVEADGYTTIERPLILDDDIALELQMSRVTSRVGRARRAATGQGSGSSETPASGPAEPDRRGVPDPGVRHEF